MSSNLRYVVVRRYKTFGRSDVDLIELLELEPNESVRKAEWTSASGVKPAIEIFDPENEDHAIKVTGEILSEPLSRSEATQIMDDLKIIDQVLGQ